MEHKEYAAVDVAKLFFCFCILFRHTGAYHEIPFSWYIQHGVFCLAVPFFFVVSGYFFGKGLKNVEISLEAKVKKYELRLLYPFCVFSAINIILAIIDMYSKGESILWIILRVGRSVLFYPYGALWYVWASMIGMLLLYWFVKKERMTQALGIGFILYLFALLCNSYYFLIEGTPVQNIIDLYLKITTSARNGFFVGFLLLGLGIVLAQKEEKIDYSRDRKYIWILLLSSGILMILEIIWIQNRTTADDHSLFLSQLIFIPMLLLILLNCKCEIERKNAVILRNLSTGIYFIHRPILTCLMYILGAFGMQNMSRIIVFVILAVLCTGVCVLVYKSKKEPFYSLLR